MTGERKQRPNKKENFSELKNMKKETPPFCERLVKTKER
jgi:hypothetical protein